MTILAECLVDCRYGGGWACVTGATDGAGREAARQLARAGFSMVLVGRNEEKLERVRGEILAETPGVGVDTVTWDMG